MNTQTYEKNGKHYKQKTNPEQECKLAYYDMYSQSNVSKGFIY